MTFQEIKDSLTQAINSFITTDRDLLLYDSHERTITHKLAEHMGGHFGIGTLIVNMIELEKRSNRSL